MPKQTIPVSETCAEWRRDLAYTAAYDALEEEFAVAADLIEARGNADVSQEEVA